MVEADDFDPWPLLPKKTLGPQCAVWCARPVLRRPFRPCAPCPLELARQASAGFPPVFAGPLPGLCRAFGPRRGLRQGLRQLSRRSHRRGLPVCACVSDSARASPWVHVCHHRISPCVCNAAAAQSMYLLVGHAKVRAPPQEERLALARAQDEAGGRARKPRG